MDEATSALDPKTERDIRDVIRHISETKLVIMIAHSIDMIKDADTVYFMDKGAEPASGSYESLLKTSAAFRDFVSEI